MEYLNAYYGAHALLVAAYGPLRAAFAGAAVQQPSSYFGGGLSGEADFALAAALLALQRWRRATHAAEAVEAALFYAQLTVAALLAMTHRGAMGWYLAAVAAAWAVLQRPPVRLPASVTPLTPYELQLAREGGTWIVLVGWRRRDHVLRDFAALARAHDVASLSGGAPATGGGGGGGAAPAGRTRFGYLDASLHPEAAAGLGVDLSLLSQQVPCVLQLGGGGGGEGGGGGAPVKRLPPLDEDGNPQNVKVDRRAITIYFGLDGGGSGAAAVAAAAPATAAAKGGAASQKKKK